MRSAPSIWRYSESWLGGVDRRVARRLKLLKRGLEQLNSKYFEDRVNEVDENREESRRIHEKLQVNPLNMKMQQKEKEVYQ